MYGPYRTGQEFWLKAKASEFEAQATIQRIEWRISVLLDRQFVENVRDIVGLYMNPPERAIVLCVDEKSQVQALPHSADSAASSRCARPTVT